MPRLWLGHSRTFTALCISHSCCVLRVTVLLEDKPSAQSEVLNALDWVFIKAISIFWCIELFFYSDESLSPCAEKQPHSMRLLPAHFTFGTVLKSKVKVSFIVNSATVPTYIQRIEIALLSTPWCIQITLNTNSRERKNTDKYKSY